MIGVAAGVSGAGGLVWLLVRRLMKEMEERYIPRIECQLHKQISAESDNNLEKTIKSLKDQMCQAMKEDQRQHDLIIKMLEQK